MAPSTGIRFAGQWFIAVLLWFVAYWGSLLAAYGVMIGSGATAANEYADLGLALAAILGLPLFLAVSVVAGLNLLAALFQ